LIEDSDDAHTARILVEICVAHAGIQMKREAQPGTG
jgi:hypothetical protein